MKNFGLEPSLNRGLIRQRLDPFRKISGRFVCGKDSARPWGITTNPTLGQGGCLGGVRGTRVPDMGPAIEHLPMPKVPQGWDVTISICPSSFPAPQQPPRPPLVGVSSRKGQCRLQPSLRPRLLP